MGRVGSGQVRCLGPWPHEGRARSPKFWPDPGPLRVGPVSGWTEPNFVGPGPGGEWTGPWGRTRVRPGPDLYSSNQSTLREGNYFAVCRIVVECIARPLKSASAFTSGKYPFYLISLKRA